MDPTAAVAHIQGCTYAPRRVAWCKVVPLLEPEPVFSPPEAFRAFAAGPGPARAIAATEAFALAWLSWWTPESVPVITLSEGPWAVVARAEARARAAELVAASDAFLDQRRAEARRTRAQWLDAVGLPPDTPIAHVPEDVARRGGLQSWLRMAGLTPAGEPRLGFTDYDRLMPLFFDVAFGRADTWFVATTTAATIPAVAAVNPDHIGICWLNR